MNKKSQAALEFLTTYGWAILLVGTALMALSYFGILDPGQFLSDRCIVGSPLDCSSSNIALGTQGFVIELSKSTPRDVHLYNLEYRLENFLEFQPCTGFSSLNISRQNKRLLICEFNIADTSFLENSIDRKQGVDFRFDYEVEGVNPGRLVPGEGSIYTAVNQNLNLSTVVDPWE